MTDGRETDERPAAGAVAVEGVVVEALPRALYRVEIEGRRHVVAHLSRDPRRNFVRILVGDRVTVELAPVNRSRGRIVRRHERGRP